MNHVDGLWFSNDTLVVLRAGDSLFRIPRSILAARSPVFRAMFEFPQPPPCGDGMADSDGDEMMDGSPVVRLHDSPTQVEPFLRAIFDSRYAKVSWAIRVCGLSHLQFFYAATRSD
jgi:hypothetical protein